MKTFFAALAFSCAVASPLLADDAVVNGGESPDKKLKVMIREGDVEIPIVGEIRLVEANKALLEFNACGHASNFEGAKTKECTTALWRPDSHAVVVMLQDSKRSADVSLFSVEASKAVKVELENPFPGIFKDFGVEEGWRCAFVRPLRWQDDGNLVLHVSGDCILKTGLREESGRWFEYEVTVSTATGKIVKSKQTLVEPKNG